MGHKLHNRIEIWKKLLLDFGKRNRLINFLEGKRSNVRIMTPSFDRLWELVVANEKEIVFPYDIKAAEKTLLTVSSFHELRFSTPASFMPHVVTNGTYCV